MILCQTYPVSIIRNAVTIFTRFLVVYQCGLFLQKPVNARQPATWAQQWPYGVSIAPTRQTPRTVPPSLSPDLP